MMGNESTPFTMPVVPAGNTGGNDGFGFGNGAWWIIILFLFCFNGWGGNWGGNGGMNGGVGSEVQRGFDHSSVIQKLDGITNGISDATYATMNAMNNGFHAVDRGLCDLGARMQDCCCQTQRAIDGVNYNLATQSCETRNLIQTNTRDIIDNANANSRAILDFLTKDKIDTLLAENQSLKQNNYMAALADAQTAELIRRINPPAVPSYSVPNPYTGVYGGYGAVGYGCNPCGPCAA